MMEHKINLTDEEEANAQKLIEEFQYKDIESYIKLVVALDLENYVRGKRIEILRASFKKQAQ